MATQRINVSMDSSHIEKIDRYAEEMCLNRSAAITVLTAQALEYKDLLARLPDMLDMMKKASEGPSAPA